MRKATLWRLLRTAFLADYFVKDAFRNELRRVLNRGEAVKDALNNSFPGVLRLGYFSDGANLS